MSIIVQKGNSFSGQYTEAVIATATDWTGTASVYQTFPGGSAIFSVALSLSGDNTKLLFTLSTEQIQNLDAGLYFVVGNMKSTILGIDTYRMDYMTVTSAAIGTEPMTTLTMTIAKVDGTPAGKETRILTNTVDGAVVTLGWDGVQVTASHPVADEVSGNIIGTETVTTKTNAAGYAQLAVIKGQIVTVSCPSFGKTIEVNTTGLNTIDLSTHF